MFYKLEDRQVVRAELSELRIPHPLWRDRLANGEVLSTVFIAVATSRVNVFETACGNRYGWGILERYGLYEAAEEGHQKWLKELEGTYRGVRNEDY
jgi:hypothetical protein